MKMKDEDDNKHDYIILIRGAEREYDNPNPVISKICLTP